MAKDTTGRLHVQVKTGGKRKLSSKLWLERQLNDPYVAKAKAAGYRSRAAFKLLEIDDKFRLLKSGMAVVDLGAAPGGWSQIAAKRVGSTEGKGKVVAIDLLEMPEIPGVDFAQLDFMDNDAPEKLTAMLGGKADVVMSDMAANTTGHRKTDQLRIVGLVETAAAFACDVLKPGRRVPGQNVPERRRCRAARPAQARLRHRASRQAGREPAGLLGALRAGDGISGRYEERV
ncbi:23S rRNA (uridine2552-2'-O)-methyltransferase [Bradyrhizobium yuanmingense]